MQLGFNTGFGIKIFAIFAEYIILFIGNRRKNFCADVAFSFGDLRFQEVSTLMHTLIH